MYYTNQPGESIRFQFKGTCVRIYDLLGPDCGQVNVKIDQNPIVVKPRFDPLLHLSSAGIIYDCGKPAGYNTHRKTIPSPPTNLIKRPSSRQEITK